MRVATLAFAILCAGVARADEGIEEPADSHVHVVTYDNFNRFIKKHPMVLMEFYAPWCGHCQQLAPVYREAAKLVAEADLPNPVVFAKYNDGNEYNRQLRGGAEDMFNYSGYPALLLFKKKKIPVANPEHWERKYMKKRWQFYGGGRDSPEEILLYLSAVSHGLDPFDEERKAKPGFYKAGGKHHTDHILELEPEGEMGFNTTILSDPSNTLWIVEFYSDRCPFCNSLAPEITKAAAKMLEEYGGKIRYGAVNSRVYDEIATQHGVTSWPWISSFYQGAKVDDMAGLGGWESVVRFSKEMYDKAWTSSPPANKFLIAAADGGDGDGGGGGSGGGSGGDKEATLEALLATAMEYNLKSATGAASMRSKAARDGLDAVIAELQAKLAPVHKLEAELEKLKTEL